jgi:hypothetical protein
MPKNLSWGPVHANNNVICAIDIRVGGDDPLRSDLLEVCFLPVNHSYKIHPHFLMFSAKIRPAWPVDGKIARLNQEALATFVTSSQDGVTARSMFERWCEQTLQLKKHKKVLPLVWNWARMVPYLQLWLGSSYEDLIYHESVRDLLAVLNFINDRNDFWGEEVPFKHPRFGEIVNRNDVELIERNSLSANCDAMIKAYNQLLRGYIPGYAPKIAKPSDDVPKLV